MRPGRHITPIRRLAARLLPPRRTHPSEGRSVRSALLPILYRISIVEPRKEDGCEGLRREEGASVRGDLRRARSVTGRERRIWHPAGVDRADAEKLAERLAAEVNGRNDDVRGLSFGAYLTTRWLPGKRLVVATSTWDGYRRKIDRHILPSLGRTPHSISQPFERIANRADVPVIRLHDLRHTHATLLIKAGAPVKVVSERLGHATPAFTIDTYQHVLPGMQADAARMFEQLIAPVTSTDAARLKRRRKSA